MKPLSNKTISDFLPKEKQYKKFFGEGLYILIRPNGSKLWRFDYRFANKRITLSLGVYPDITIDNVLELHSKLRDDLKRGTNPQIQLVKDRQFIKDQKFKLITPTKFLLESDGSLHIKLGKRTVFLTAIEAKELHSFLEATKQVNKSEVQ